MVRRRRRLGLLRLLPVVLLVGLAARFALPGALGDAAGGVMYTALVYLLVALAAPERPPAFVAAWALSISVAVELFQLTSVPSDLADAFGPSRLVLGTAWAAADLPAYAAGALLAALADHARRRSARRLDGN